MTLWARPGTSAFTAIGTDLRRSELIYVVAFKKYLHLFFIYCSGTDRSPCPPDANVPAP